MKTTLNDGVIRFTFSGDILSTNVQEIRPKLISGLDQHPDAKMVVVDLAACRIIDSMGLNLLIALYRESEKRSLSFRAENPCGDVTRLFSFLNLTERFGLKPQA